MLFSKKLKKGHFLEFIAYYDYQKKYTRLVRIFCHISMWLFFLLLLGLNFHFGYKFGILSSFLMSLRMIVCNITVFYLFFYLFVPYTFQRGHLISFAFSIILLLILWLILNHYFYVIIHMLEIKIDMGILDGLIKKTSEISIIEVLSPRNILGHLFEIIMAIAPFFFLKIMLDLTRLYSKSVKSINEIQNLNLQTLKMENKFLLTQLNPHFLFNTLNNIYALALKKDELAPKIIIKLSEIMRYTLYDANTDFVPLLKEIAFTENYFEMERMRYSSSYQIEKEVDIKDGMNLKIAPLIFFVFVENAFKYGLISDMPILKIFIKNFKNNLYFSATNDKLPLNENKSFSGGIGLENVKRRLDMIYPDRYQLNIVNDEKTFKVELNIEL